MENNNTGFNKWQYSVFVKNGVDGQLVVRSNDEEEFWGMVGKVNKYVIKKNGGELPAPVKDYSYEKAEPAPSEGKQEGVLSCQQCGEPATERQGTSKAGKAYHAIFCSSGNRTHTVWL